MAGVLIQACSDNNGSTGPTFECREAKAGASARALAECTKSSAPSTGFANTSEDIRVVVGINPSTVTPGHERVGVTASVRNKNGQPLAGKTVQFSTDVGSLDQTVGTTNAGGTFSTSLRISPSDAANAQGLKEATVTVFVEGATGTGKVLFGTNPVLTLIPISDVQNNVANAANVCPTVGGFTITYTVSGGVPPYSFSRSNEFGANATLSSGGVFTVKVFGPFSEGGGASEVITVTDAAGNTVTATVEIKCITPP